MTGAVYTHQPYCLLDLPLERFDALVAPAPVPLRRMPDGAMDCSMLTAPSLESSLLTHFADNLSLTTARGSPLSASTPYSLQSPPRDDTTGTASPLVLSRNNTPVVLAQLVKQVAESGRQPSPGAGGMPVYPYRMPSPTKAVRSCPAVPPLIVPDREEAGEPGAHRHPMSVAAPVLQPADGVCTPCTIKPSLKAGVAGAADHPCRDFARGVCRRGSMCRFTHEGAEEDDKGEVCKDYLRGDCKRDHCRFIHSARRTPKKVKDAAAARKPCPFALLDLAAAEGL
eukprot:TRINITY_DN13404_c0_g1_i1.p2 TRINITY_DN13404_c0_g1~~TRINITY_DN13404_c0_g1_i1.p2  ORF type:complete len:283 (+),score=63.96 TRINITY_DN13404_c0_g1_i1:44-892(+)